MIIRLSPPITCCVHPCRHTEPPAAHPPAVSRPARRTRGEFVPSPVTGVRAVSTLRGCEQRRYRRSLPSLPLWRQDFSGRVCSGTSEFSRRFCGMCTMLSTGNTVGRTHGWVAPHAPRDAVGLQGFPAPPRLARCQEEAPAAPAPRARPPAPEDPSHPPLSGTAGLPLHAPWRVRQKLGLEPAALALEPLPNSKTRGRRIRQTRPRPSARGRGGATAGTRLGVPLTAGPRGPTFPEASIRSVAGRLTVIFQKRSPTHRGGAPGQVSRRWAGHLPPSSACRALCLLLRDEFPPRRRRRRRRGTVLCPCESACSVF